MRRFLFVALWLAARSASGQPAAIPVPPAEHPRLYLRSADLPVIRQRLSHPRLAPVWTKLLQSAHTPPAGLAREDTTRLIAAKALVSLLNKDDATGREALDLLRDFLPRAEFDLKAQDVSRPIGALMLSAAMVYDWCFPQLSAADKTLIVTHLERLARMLETGYPPARGSSLTGHAGEAMLMRDLLSAGIAIYDERPEMYRLAAQRILSEHVPARNFFYPAASHHQGSAYGPYRYAWEVLCGWIFRRMTRQDLFVPEQAQLPYRWAYTRRPDDRLLVDGDVFRGGSTSRSDMLTAAYYGDPYLQNQFLRAKDFSRADPIEQILFWDPALEPKAAVLPLARSFGFPLTATVARTSWDEGAAIVEMKLHEFQFNNHQHLDNGAFQIYYRGPLAIDSGLYAEYGTDHDTNYLKRTVAHNAMLVFDPDEKVRGGKAVNDGGQRWPANGSEPRTLDFLLQNGYKVAGPITQQTSDDLCTLEGDLTASYSGKVASYRRTFLWVNLHDSKRPAALIVYDRIVSAKPEFKKTWLLHSIDEPRVQGALTVIRQNGGKLVNQTLEPADFKIATVGGPGREFEINGQNHPPNRAPEARDEAGAWRVEISPAAQRAADTFLNVMQVMDDNVEPLPVIRLKDGVRIGDRVLRLPEPLSH
jgi:heparin/heparan-sulfate lyase